VQQQSGVMPPHSKVAISATLSPVLSPFSSQESLEFPSPL